MITPTYRPRGATWVELDALGAVASLWEAEDPISADDTAPPLFTDKDGYTIVNVGIPAYPVIGDVYADALTADRRAAAVAAASAYFQSRRWISQPITAIAAPDGFPEHCRPSVRQWYMRFAAQATGVTVPNFYRDNLVVTDGRWARR